MDERDELLLRLGKLFVERERAIEVANAQRERIAHLEEMLKRATAQPEREGGTDDGTDERLA